MAIIDDYLRAVLGKNGEELFLSSGKAPVARTKGAPTPLSNAPLSSEQIEAMIAEVVPAKRMQGAQFRFQYSDALGAFIGLGQRGEGTIEVIVRKSSAGEPSFGESAVAASAPAPIRAETAPAPVQAAAPSAPEPADEDFSAIPLEAAPIAAIAPPPPAPAAAPAAPIHAAPPPVHAAPVAAPLAAPRPAAPAVPAAPAGPRVMPVFNASAVISGAPPAINKGTVGLVVPIPT